MVSQIRPLGSAAAHPPVEAVLMSWKTSSVVGGALQEDGILLFGVCLVSVLLCGLFRVRSACNSPLLPLTTDGREREQ